MVVSVSGVGVVQYGGVVEEGGEGDPNAETPALTYFQAK